MADEEEPVVEEASDTRSKRGRDESAPEAADSETAEPRSYHMYALMAEQLEADGYGELASELRKRAKIEPTALDDEGGLKDRLYHLFRRAQTTKTPIIEDLDHSTLDLFTDEEAKLEMPMSKPFPNYTTRFATNHKMAAKCATFSQDGELVATGSADTSIKLLQVNKIHYHSQVKGDAAEDYTQTRPVIRTLYDHEETITDLDFHPIEPFLVSSSKDCHIKFFDHSKNMKKNLRYIVETHPVMSIHFHPNGDFLLAGTEHPMVRLYDVNTFQAYVSTNMPDHHKGPIHMVRWAPQGNIFASASKDGSVKIWDGVENKCIHTIMAAHEGEEVSSVQFSPSGKYLLSGGQDSVVRLWDVGSARQIQSFVGHRQQGFRSPSIFTNDGDFVLSPDVSGVICAWDTRTGDMTQKLTGHSKTVRWLASSPCAEEFVSCGEDNRARFWAASKDNSALSSI